MESHLRAQSPDNRQQNRIMPQEDQRMRPVEMAQHLLCASSTPADYEKLSWLESKKGSQVFASAQICLWLASAPFESKKAQPIRSFSWMRKRLVGNGSSKCVFSRCWYA